MKKVIFTLFIALFLGSFTNAQNNQVIDAELQNILNQKSNDLVEVNIHFKSQLSSKQLNQKTRRVADKEIKREIVVSELKNHSEESQSDVLSVLKAEELNGKVADINCLWIANSIYCKATSDVIYKLSSHPDIKALSYNKEIQLISPEAIKEFSNAADANLRGTAAHHVVTINADDVWNQGYTGKNVVVAVLDSGTNYEHKDIKANLWEGYDDEGNLIHGWNFIANNSDISDAFGHGTHCAGIVCGDGTSGQSTGVAPDAKLMTVKIVGDGGTGTPAQMLSGVQFAVANGANILSMSLGFKDTQLSIDQKESIRAAFDNVLAAGAIVCAAAGNDGNDWGAPNNVDYPAACPSPWRNPDQTLEGGLSSVVCVGANDLAASSQGPSTWEGTSYNDYPYNDGESMGLIRPDISAPGNLVYSLNHLQSDKYRLNSGTSQATPCVAGVMALMLEKNSTLTPAQLTEIIETTAANKPAKKNNTVGAGRIDALAAVNAVQAGALKPYIKLASVTPEILTQGDNKTLTVKVKNVGKGSSANATKATLSLENDEYVTISDPNFTLGQISVGNTKEATFNLNIASQTPNGHNACFTIVVDNGDGTTWKYPFSVKISATPELVISSVTPGVVNVDQDVNINVTMKNNGTAAMDGNTELTLSTLSSELKYVTIVDNSATIGSLGVGESGVGTFTIRANNTAPNNYKVDLFLETYSVSNNATNLIYEFEDNNEGWTSFAATNNITEPWWHSSDAINHGKKAKDSRSGSGHIMSETVKQSLTQYDSPIDNYLVSPTKYFVSRRTEVSFYARANYDSDKEHFGLAVSENGNSSANDFTMLQDWTIQQQGTTWNKYTVNLGAYAGKEVYIAIRHFFTNEEWNDSNQADLGYGVDALNIDDIMVTNVKVNAHSVPTYSSDDKNMFNVYIYNMKELTAPKNLVATSTSVSEVALTWDAVTDAQSYNVYCDGKKIANVKENSYTHSNLTHNTTYRYTVAAVYSGVEFEHSIEASATTQQKQLSVVLKSFSPEIIYIDGETSVNFDLTILNDGLTQLYAKAYYTLSSTSDDYVSITNKDTDMIAALNPNAEATKTINVKFSENTPNNSVINFNLNITSVSNQANEKFTFDLPFSVTIKNDIKAPKGLTVKAKSENSVTLGWNSTSNAISYNVYRNGAFVGYTSSTSYFDNDGLTPDTEYYYEVTSVTETGESSKSEKITVKTSAGSSKVVLQSFDLEKPVGETILTATLINTGNVNTPVSTATLKCADQYVTILDGTYNLGSIAAGGTVTATFRVQISNGAPLNHNLNFEVDVKSDKTQKLTYTFDDNLNGWTTINANSDEHTWYHSSEALEQHNLSGGNNHSNPNIDNIYSPSSGGYIISESYCNKTGSAITPDDYIVSPMQVEPTDSTTFEFYVRSTASAYKDAGEHFGVFVSTMENVTSSTFESKSGWEWTLPNTVNPSSRFNVEKDSFKSDEISITTKSEQRSGDTSSEVVTIDNTTTEKNEATSMYVPVYNNYEYSITQQYYKASEINKPNGGTISAIAFKTSDKNNNNAYTRNIEVYIVNIDNEDEYLFGAKTMKKLSSSDCVFTGEITFNPESWVTIALTTKFEYNGKNLLICVNDITGDSYVSPAAYYYTFASGEGMRCLYQRNSKSKYDPTTSDISAYNNTGNVPYIQFTFEGNGNDVSTIPAAPVVTATANGQNSIVLTWNSVDGATSYKVYNNGNVIAEVIETKYTVKNLQAGSDYCFSVSAVGEGGESTATEACATTEAAPVAPATPTNLTATANGQNTIVLAWNSVDGATKYKVYNNGNVITAEVTATTYTVENLQAGTNYCFSVSALNAVGESALTEPACATTEAEQQGGDGGNTGEDVVTIGETNITSSNVYPYISTYAYSTSQQIYTAAEIGKVNGGTIEKIAFYLYNADVNKTVNNVKIYIKHTDKESFASTSDWDKTVTGDHLVYEGNPTITNSVLEIPLTTSFKYNGTDNLLVCVDVNLKQGTEATPYKIYETSAERAMYRGDTRNYGPDSDNYYNVTARGRSKSIPVISLTFGSGVKKPTISVDKTRMAADNSDYVKFTVTPEDAEIWYTTGTEEIQLTTNDKSFKTDIAGTYSFYAKKDGVTSNPIEIEAVADLAGFKWTRYSVDLKSYKGQKIWVAIRHFGSGNNANAALAIDDVSINDVKVTNTSSFSVTVNPSINTFSGNGAWNVASNWSKGSVPTTGEDIIVNGNVTIESGTVTVKSIIINSGSLTVNSGATLKVTGTFLNANTKAFIINDGAQVFQNNDNVAATFNMYVDNPSSWGYDHKGGWQFISSPMLDAAIDGFKPTSETDYDLFKYDGTQELQWINVKNHGTDFESIFQLGRGYIASYEAETTSSFEGTINNETSFTFKDVKPFNAEDHYGNFYLLGNPFTFNMNWTNVSASGVYNGYATISYNDGSYDYHTSGTINVGDGFMVKSTGADPVLSYAHNTRARNEKHANLNVMASNIYGSDNVIINLAGQEDEGFSKLENINKDIAEIYVENNGSKYGIFSFDEDINEVKLGFKASRTGTHIIRIKADGKYEYITLVDNITGVETDMLKDEYAFTVFSTNERRDRFTVKFCKKAEITNDNFVYQSGDELIIEGNGSVQIIDVMGRVVYSDKLNETTRVNVSHLNKAAYIVRRIDGNNVNSQKIIVF